MLKDLSFGEPQGVAPKKLERKVETLPQPVALAYDKTPLGEARTLPVAVSIAADRVKVGTRLVSLLKKYARESPAGAPTIPFKASFTVTDEEITLYWQKKPVRAEKPFISALATMPNPDAGAHGLTEERAREIGEARRAQGRASDAKKNRKGGGAD